MKIKAIISIFLILVLVFGCIPMGAIAQEVTTYYVSVSGSDSNTGLSEDAPLKTITAVNNLELAEGTRVLFKRGDIWRDETLYCQSGVYYGAYGSGEKPAFYGSKENYARVDYWTPTDTANVYESTFTLDDDIGAIVFDGGNHIGIRYTYNNSLSSLYHGAFIYEDSTGLIYLYNATGNPGAVYSEMEFIQTNSLIQGRSINNEIANNITIEDIALKYGNYGYQLNSSALGAAQKNVTLRRLDISYIGGKYILEGYRGGNGIEIYGSCENVLVEDCNITQVYDTAFTFQMHGGKNHYFNDVTLKGCDISYCHWTTEFWFRPYNESVDYATIDNLNIIGNKFSYSGCGFGTQLRNTEADTNKSTFITSLGFDNYYSVDINITDNIFCGAKENMFYLGFGGYTPSFSGNKYILSDTTMIGYVGNTLDTSCGDALTEMFFETDAQLGKTGSIATGARQSYYNFVSDSDLTEAVAVDSNTPYKLGFWYNGEAEVTVSDEKGNAIASASLSDTTEKWHEIYFTTPDNCEAINIALSGGSDVLLTPYPDYKIIRFENGMVALKDRNYTVGETVELIVLPDNGYELDGDIILKGSNGLVSAQYTEADGKAYFTAPDDDLKITCFFRKSGYNRGDNLIQDSGFDNTNSSWTVFWSSSLSTAAYEYADTVNKTGDACLSIQAHGGGTFQKFSVEAGCTYEISFLWAPCATNSTTSQLRVTVGDNYGTYDNSLNFIYNNTISSQGKIYQKFFDEFTAVSTGDVYLRLDRQSCTPNTVLIDDVSIRKLTEIDTRTKYPIAVSDDILNGTLNVNVAEAVAGDTVTVEPIGDDGYNLKSITALSGDTSIELSKLAETDKYSFIMPDGAVTLSAEFEFQNVNESGSVNLIKNGTFDNGSADWTGWADGKSKVVTATSDFANAMGKTGDNCLVVPQKSNSMYQSVSLKAGVTYTLSFLIAPCASGGDYTSTNVVIGGGIFTETFTSPNYEYEWKSYTFTPTEDKSVPVFFIRQDYTGTVYIDDISLTCDYSVSLKDADMFTTGKYIFGIEEGTTPEEVIAGFDYQNCEYRFDGDTDIKTGDTFTLYAYGAAVLTKTAAVEGDCNSDGKVSVTDLVALKKYCANMREFTEAQKYATRIDGSSEADSSSLCALRKILID